MTNNEVADSTATKSKVALSRWKKLTGTAMFINRLGKKR